MSIPRLAVLVSGSGTILEAMIEVGLPIDVVASDRPCRGLEVAKSGNITTALVGRSDFGGFRPGFDRAGYSTQLRTVLQEHEVDLVAMAGFGTVVTSELHEAFPGLVLNTHPSLLPLFKGWHAVEAALAAGASETGCTVHLATVELDEGPILARERVPIHAGDDAVILQERIKTVERVLYPKVIRRALTALSEGRLLSSLAIG